MLCSFCDVGCFVAKLHLHMSCFDVINVCVGCSTAQLSAAVASARVVYISLVYWIFS
jgi:hypothetical protein